MAIGRPKKSSAELIRVGARKGRIEARQREEALEQGAKIEQEEKAAAARGMSLASFIERVKKERESFFERLDPGETVCKEYGATFNWRQDHPLTVIKNYADQIINGTIISCEFTRLACARFLADLTHNFVPRPSWPQGRACLRPDRQVKSVSEGRDSPRAASYVWGQNSKPPFFSDPKPDNGRSK